MTLHILPPPPEEILSYEIARGRSVTTQSPANITSQHGSLFSSNQVLFTIDTPDKLTPDRLQKSAPPEQGYDSFRSSKQTIPPAMKPIDGTYLSQDQQPITALQRNLLTNLAASCQQVVLTKLHRQYSQTIPKELPSLETKRAESLVRSSSHGQIRNGHASLVHQYLQQRPTSTNSTRKEDNKARLVNNYDATLRYLCHNANIQSHYRKNFEENVKPHHNVREDYRKAIQNGSLNQDIFQGYYDVMINANREHPAILDSTDACQDINNLQKELEAQAMDLRNIPEIDGTDNPLHHNSNSASHFDDYYPQELMTATTSKIKPFQWNEEMPSHMMSQSKITRHTSPSKTDHVTEHSSQHLHLSPDDVLIHFEADTEQRPYRQEFTTLPKPPHSNGMSYYFSPAHG